MNIESIVNNIKYSWEFERRDFLKKAAFFSIIAVAITIPVYFSIKAYLKPDTPQCAQAKETYAREMEKTPALQIIHQAALDKACEN
ncbi:hypothetical protein [Paracoccus marcusii]|uniref:hypothetical protein n=1 Tax=Paracoccus marcusii TaxID=59779 RepID=UPI0032674BBC